jgi:hypothetical protein
MSTPRRSLGPVIAYMLTLLGLVLGGIWVWNALRTRPAPPGAPATSAAPPRIRPEADAAPAPHTDPQAHAVPPHAAGPPPSGEAFSATERQQLENILRQKPAGNKR